jgi:hypothetical protein
MQINIGTPLHAAQTCADILPDSSTFSLISISLRQREYVANRMLDLKVSMS